MSNRSISLCLWLASGGPLCKLRFVDTLRVSASFRRLTSLIGLRYLRLP